MVHLAITGSSGFIGTNLVAAAKQNGHQVTAVDKKAPRITLDGVNYLTIDIMRTEEIAEALANGSIDVLIHLAARTDLLGKTLVDYEENTVGTESVLAAVENSETIRTAIFASTQLVKNVSGDGSEMDEPPKTLYGRSKLESERIIKERKWSRDLIWCIVRPTTIWGPWMSDHYIRYLKMIERGRYFHVGSAKRYKSYGYVENTCHQLLQLCQAEKASVDRETFYLADYEALELKEWSELIRSALSAPKIRTIPEDLAATAAKVGDMINRLGWTSFPFNTFRLKNVLAQYVYDMSKTEKLVPRLPCTIQEGVQNTCTWFRQYAA